MTDNFETAYRHMLEFEGGWVHNPVDVGGETYAGVSRRNWPDWPGWNLIDEHKRLLGEKFTVKDLNGRLENDALLQSLIREFYRHNFWDPVGDEMLPFPQLVRKMFDTAVNMGPTMARKLLQRALNSLGAKLVVDGMVGPKTRLALGPRDEQTVITKYCQMQKEQYEQIVANAPSQNIFLQGWLRRAAFRG